MLTIDLNSDEKVSFLVSLSRKMGLSEEEVLAMYLLLEDKIFFLFDVFQGKSIKFPSMRSFHRGLSLVERSRIMRLKRDEYLVNGIMLSRERVCAGDCLVVEGVNCRALSSPMVFLGGTYILVDENKKAKEEEDE